MRKMFLCNALALFASVLMLSCDTLTYPSINTTPTQQWVPGQIVWHDLVTPNPKLAMDFYKDVFGWTYTTIGGEQPSYYVIWSGGNAIGGIVPLRGQQTSQAEWVISMSVSNVDAAVAANEAQGGKTVVKSATYKGRGKAAFVQDPQGAYISYLKSTGGDPGKRVGPWMWDELWTDDLTASLNYYKDITATSSTKIEQSKVDYRVLLRGDKKLVGIMGSPVDQMRSAWIPYIRTQDVAATTVKAKAAGATFLMEPNAAVREGSVAVLRDPTGATFAIQLPLSNLQTFQK